MMQSSVFLIVAKPTPCSLVSTALFPCQKSYSVPPLRIHCLEVMFPVGQLQHVQPVQFTIYCEHHLHVLLEDPQSVQGIWFTHSSLLLKELVRSLLFVLFVIGLVHAYDLLVEQ